MCLFAYLFEPQIEYKKHYIFLRIILQKHIIILKNCLSFGLPTLPMDHRDRVGFGQKIFF
jgi:hypothetical protein